MPSFKFGKLLGVKKPKSDKNAALESSQPTSTRSSLSLSPRSVSTTIDNTPTASQAVPIASTTAVTSSTPSPRLASTFEDIKKFWSDHRVEIMASTRTVLNIVEKGLDGVPVPGLKAAAGGTSEILKVLQTSVENEEKISDVVKAVENTQKALLISVTSDFDSSLMTSPEGKRRIDELSKELDDIRTSMEQASKSNKNLTRRILDAERVAQDLSSVTSKIQEVFSRFQMKTLLSVENKVVDMRLDIKEIKIKQLNQEGRDLRGSLRPVVDAFHNARNASPSCFEGTREQLLKDISIWFDDMDSSTSRVFWLNGLAGTGKTTVARSVAEHAHEQDRLAGSFFFSRQDAATRDAAAVIPTILYQLATRHPTFRPFVCSAIESDPDVRDRAVTTQAQILLRNLGSAVVPTHPYLIVVDAVDECAPGDDDEGIDVVRVLIDTVASLPSFKLFITSRVEQNVKNILTSERHNARKLALHCDIEKHVVQSDIQIYLERKFSELAQKRNLESPFPSAEDLGKLVERSGTLFIYATTVFKYISDRNSGPKLRLQQILDQSPSEAPYQYRKLDAVYSQIISEATTTIGNPETHARTLYTILSTLIVLQESIPISVLADLVFISKEETEIILQRLSSILLAENDAPVRLYHPSFSDFITDAKRCQDDIRRFVVVPSEVHMCVACRCIEIMNTHLRRDICDIQDASLLNSEVPDLENRLAQAIPRHLRYACKYWHAHMRLGGKLSEKILDELTQFTRKHLLHWLEMLSLIGELFAVPHGIPSLITYLRDTLPESHSTPICASFNDIHHTIAKYEMAITESALHVYHSALVTMPCCHLNIEFASCERQIPLLISQRSGSWDSQILASGGHSKGTSSVAFSHNGKHIISGSYDHTVRMWDATTGTLRHLLTGHSDWVSSVVFSPDDQYIASGSDDCTAQVWDATTGMLRHTLTGHKGWVSSVAFSPDGKFIASGSWDCTVRVWDAPTATLNHTLTGHNGSVYSVAFSPDGKHIASGSKDCSVRVWDASMGTLRHTFIGHNRWVNSAAFSPDGKHIASGSGDRTVRVWDATTGTLQHTLSGHHDYVMSVSFSPDGLYIVSRSMRGNVIVWNAGPGNRYDNINGRLLSPREVYAPRFALPLEPVSQQGHSLSHPNVEDTRWTLFEHDEQSGWIYHLGQGGAWRRVCWLPVELRGVAIAHSGQKVIIGAKSGAVTILDFSLVT